MAGKEKLLENTCNDVFLSENVRSKISTWTIPYGGNAFISKSASDAAEVISDSGLGNWNSNTSVISLYFYTRCTGRVLAALRLFVYQGSSTATISMAHNGSDNAQSRQITLEGPEYYLANCGYFDISTPGYTRFDLQGVEKTGAYYGDVSHLILLELPFTSTIPCQTGETEYFYNEVFVPNEQDVIGAYFSVIGFTDGYFGIQVISETERRILFSIWSAYQSDDPEQIPEEYKVKLIRKGENVQVGEFGNEGSGAQSYLRYMWQPGKTFKFINGWMLVASFEKPKVSTYFAGPYSFSENFIPDNGYIERHCLFKNQWARSVEANWTECTTAKFTADDTANKHIRLDVGVAWMKMGT
ncbi:hypothetical protein Ocin01_17070 [Orchesella cincta]|uniref:DUF5077 domain-containing protein n=1 Tax=Orchesella cincta TaxID=48709 RepID=A0A1D2M9K6_ORCCI|nr:hypothetical protein Ocin01_17070 [Orchesella cincta]